MENCPTCGEPVNGQKFCPHCGTKLGEADAVETAVIGGPATAPGPVATVSDATRALFTAVPPQRYFSAALGGVIVYAAAWVLAVVVTLLLLIGIVTGGSNQIDWSWLFSAPGQLVGLSLGGVISASASVLGASASVSLLGLPLVLTAAVVVGMVILSRRDERLSPTPSRGPRWLLSAAAGLALAIVAILVSAIFPLQEGSGGAGTGIASLVSVHVSLSAASFTLFLGALAVGTLSSYFARARVVANRGGNVVRTVGSVRGSVRATLPTIGLYLGVASVLLAVTVLVIFIIKGGGSALWSALLWLPTLVADGLAFINLASITVSGSAASLIETGGAPSSAWMPSVLPIWGTILVIVVNLVLVVIIGAVLRLRRASIETSTATIWATTVISFGAAGAVLSLIGGVALWTHLDTASLGGLLDGALGSNSTTSGLGGLGGAGSSALDAYASLTLIVGPAAWTFLIFAVLGALVEVSATYVVPLLLPLLPASTLAGASRLLARVGVPLPSATDAGAATAGGAATAEGAEAAPAAASVPMTPERKRRLIVIVASIGAAVVVVVLAAIAVSVLTTTVFSPSREVQSYLGSLVAKNADQAAAIGNINAPDDSRVLLTNPVLRATPDGISGYSVISTQTSGDSAIVTAELDQNGAKSTETYTLHRDGTTWLFFPVWKMNATSLPSLTVQLSSGISSLDINGAKVPVSSAQISAGSLRLPVFPGRYTVSLGGKSQWVSAKPGSVTIEASEEAPSEPVVMAVTPTTAFKDAVNQQVRDFLNGCVAQNVLMPTGCPFEEFGFGQESAVVWTITTMPTLSFRQSDDGTWSVSSDEEGRATVTYNEDFFGVTAESDYSDFDIDGTVKFVDGKPVFTEQPGY